MSGAYYNEFDPNAAAWLREIIKRGLIAPGDVDERSILDVRAVDLAGYSQVHLFAGIGTWSYALRRAGWADSRPVWTASLPCQPFSTAGKQGGFKDDRHLWPHVYEEFIDILRPRVVIGEQVSSPDGLAWFDAVSHDLEIAGYAAGALDLCAAGVGAPHIRQRLYWVGYTFGAGLEGLAGNGDSSRKGEGSSGSASTTSTVSGLADSASKRRLRESGLISRQTKEPGGTDLHESGGSSEIPNNWTHANNGFWRDSDWLACRDGKWRSVEPGTFPLAHGAPARMGRLRGYGNGIVCPLAEEFIKTVIEVI